uniref:hypothetical protein n=1 Tax=Lachnoclostridium phocaeense TaxID=1871021 RepID=UPI0026DC8BC1|nr:hypothetical protein [Lachnoclostridium phocaeense]
MLWFVFDQVVPTSILGTIVKEVVAESVTDTVADLLGIDRGPSVFEKIETVLTDVETEGRKRGCTKAAEEYKSAIKYLEKEYDAAVKFLGEIREQAASGTERLFVQLEHLTREKESLQAELDKKADRVADKYDIPVCEVKKCCIGSRFTGGPGASLAVLDLVYAYKRHKLLEAEQAAYSKAREEYEARVAELRQRLTAVAEKADRNMKRYVELCQELLDEMARAKAEVVELGILLR